MQNYIKVRLQIPYSEKPGEYFSFSLKDNVRSERARYKMPGKMLLLSDIEGNFMALQRLLIKNKVIDRHHNWTFDDGHLVILGDCFDRGDHVIECLWLIYSLEEKARLEGGHIHFILGNHEIMNLSGDWRYVHPKYAKAVSENKSFTALYDGNNKLWQWLLTKNIMEVIGDVLIVHGGISPELNQYPFAIEEINELVRSHYTGSGRGRQNPLQELVFNSEQSPFWYRGYYENELNEQEVDETLNKFGVNTIITGHTIVEEVQPYFNGKVININTDHANGNSQALLIKRNKYFKIDVNRKTRNRIK